MRGTLLVAGTTSDAGKSVVTTAICRSLARRGVSVAPFKAQNMSNNSMVVAGLDGSGAEIGRAQWIQAVAAKATPEVAMNPVLLKPGSDLRSHVVFNGQPAGVLGANEFAVSRTGLQAAAFAAFDDLRSRFDVVVAEGAGSPAEINLRAGDFVNMGLAQHGKLPVIVVGDIDRGGVYAAFHGTLALLDAADQSLVAGFVINKFRGDQSLLTPANDQLSRLTGRPILGVLPFEPNLWLDSEDALDAGVRGSTAVNPLRVAVVRLPRISNFTDVDALGLEPDVDVRFASDRRDVLDADLIVLPGTRSTFADLAWLRDRGLDTAIAEHAAAGLPVLGICGGMQMLGRSIVDPAGIEGTSGTSVAGLGLINADTEFSEHKTLRLPTGSSLGAQVTGYVIHHGVVSTGVGDEFAGGIRNGNVFATMWHGSLEADDFRAAFLAEVAAAVGRTREPSGVCFADARESRLESLADLVDEHLDMAAIDSLIAGGAPRGLPVVLGGLGSALSGGADRDDKRST